jgi:hydrogenase nickel incorporation protein HypB
MCATCGCSDTAHEHPHGHGHSRVITLEQDVLAKNDQLAARNRQWFAEHGIVALNLMSSPGSGKTTLLERTIRDVGAELAVSVIEGDQETVLDAERIRAAGCAAVQINTGSGCHLDAEMLARGIGELQPPDRSVVMIENVGNLVCPAEFRVGEDARIMVSAVTEGEDKPLKYPLMFRTCELVVINKIDLLPHLEFDLDAFLHNLDAVHPGVPRMLVSARTGEGVDAFRDWLMDLPA